MAAHSVAAGGSTPCSGAPTHRRAWTSPPPSSSPLGAAPAAVAAAAAEESKSPTAEEACSGTSVGSEHFVPGFFCGERFQP